MLPSDETELGSYTFRKDFQKYSDELCRDHNNIAAENALCSVTLSFLAHIINASHLSNDMQTHDKQDIVQTAALNIMSYLRENGYDAIKVPDAFARQSLRNTTINHIRNRQYRPLVLGGNDPEIQNIFDGIPAREENEQHNTSFDALQRAMFERIIDEVAAKRQQQGIGDILRNYYYAPAPKTMAQLAEEYGCPQGTIKSRIHTYKADLRNALQNISSQAHHPEQECATDILYIMSEIENERRAKPEHANSITTTSGYGR